MKLSIILPTYNMEKYLERCLDSVLNQDIKNTDYEIIIINDESTDNSLQIAQKYALKHKNIIIHTKKNGGLGAARNTGLELAKGEYIYFLDSDDYITENSLSSILKIVKDHKLEILTFISSMTTHDNLNESSFPNNPGEIESMTGFEYIGNKSYRNEVWWYIIDHAFLKKIKLRFDEGQWLEDAMFTANIFLKSKKMGHVPLDIHRYRIRPDSAVRNKSKSHYNKMLIDQEKVINDFGQLISKTRNETSVEKKCLKRLRTRQQSFMFFYIVRFIQSDLDYNFLKQKLNKFKNINAHPLNQFIGEEYNGLKYRTLSFIFNNQIILLPCLNIYRLFKSFIYRIKK